MLMLGWGGGTDSDKTCERLLIAVELLAESNDIFQLKWEKLQQI